MWSRIKQEAADFYALDFYTRKVPDFFTKSIPTFFTQTIPNTFVVRAPEKFWFAVDFVGENFTIWTKVHESRDKHSKAADQANYIDKAVPGSLGVHFRRAIALAYGGDDAESKAISAMYIASPGRLDALAAAQNKSGFEEVINGQWWRLANPFNFANFVLGAVKAGVLGLTDAIDRRQTSGSYPIDSSLPAKILKGSVYAVSMITDTFIRLPCKLLGDAVDSVSKTAWNVTKNAVNGLAQAIFAPLKGLGWLGKKGYELVAGSNDVSRIPPAVEITATESRVRFSEEKSSSAAPARTYTITPSVRQEAVGGSPSVGRRSTLPDKKSPHSVPKAGSSDVSPLPRGRRKTVVATTTQVKGILEARHHGGLERSATLRSLDSKNSKSHPNRMHNKSRSERDLRSSMESPGLKLTIKVDSDDHKKPPVSPSVLPPSSPSIVSSSPTTIVLTDDTKGSAPASPGSSSAAVSKKLRRHTFQPSSRATVPKSSPTLQVVDSRRSDTPRPKAIDSQSSDSKETVSIPGYISPKNGKR